MEKRKLSALASFRKKVAEMEAQGMRAGKPGDPCCCGCIYEGKGGSSVADNDAANDKAGLKSPGCKTKEKKQNSKLVLIWVEE